VPSIPEGKRARKTAKTGADLAGKQCRKTEENRDKENRDKGKTGTDPELSPEN
jgi:hypothetical protein